MIRELATAALAVTLSFGPLYAGSNSETAGGDVYVPAGTGAGGSAAGPVAATINTAIEAVIGGASAAVSEQVAAVASAPPGSPEAKAAVGNLISAIVSGSNGSKLTLTALTSEQKVSARALLAVLVSTIGSSAELNALLAELDP
jgi:hypothetical protein